MSKALVFHKMEGMEAQTSKVRGQQDVRLKRMGNEAAARSQVGKDKENRRRN